LQGIFLAKKLGEQGRTILFVYLLVIIVILYISN